MPDKYQFLPFMIGAITTIPGARVNVNRIVEALIIASVTAGISLYGVTRVIETKMNDMERRLAQVETQESIGRQEMRTDIKEVRQFIEKHIIKE